VTFRVGVTRDLRTVDGEPCFGRRAFDVLAANADIKWEWLSEDPKEVTPEIAARYDGLHLNLPRVTAAIASTASSPFSVSIWAMTRLRSSASFIFD